MKNPIRLIVCMAALLFVARPASAELLHGQYHFPGKFMVGARPLGAQVWMVSGGGNFGTYKFAIDFSGKLLDLPKLTLWLGGEFNLGGRDSLAQIEPGIFAMLTLEKLLNIPLVPLVMAGLVFPINVFYSGTNDFTLGGFGVKIGGGAYYFLTKNIGLGGEIHFAFAGAFGGVAGSAIGSGWLGYFDFVSGMRAAF
ncbi:MAG TPA: hypothetical protein VFF06_36350 [Polyangia bacterium]|nr:hypothetical protein [Polyangia bacterium]